jgi:hypothetical protein
MCLSKPVKVADDNKDSSLLLYRIYYCRKKLYDTGVVRSFRVKICHLGTEESFSLRLIKNYLSASIEEIIKE